VSGCPPTPHRLIAAGAPEARVDGAPSGASSRRSPVRADRYGGDAVAGREEKVSVELDAERVERARRLHLAAHPPPRRRTGPRDASVRGRPQQGRREVPEDGVVRDAAVVEGQLGVPAGERAIDGADEAFDPHARAPVRSSRSPSAPQRWRAARDSAQAGQGGDHLKQVHVAFVGRRAIERLRAQMRARARAGRRRPARVRSRASVAIAPASAARVSRRRRGRPPARPRN
jgi:hypothetical protein